MVGRCIRTRVARAKGHTGVGKRLRRVNVAVSQRTLRAVWAVWESADAEVIIRADIAQQQRRVAAHGVIAVQIIALLRQHCDGQKVRPTLAHTTGLPRTDSHSTSDETIAHAMPVFVDDDVIVEVAVTVRVRPGPDIHLHASGAAISWCREIRIVCAAAILCIGLHRITACATATKVVGLEVSRALRETQPIQSVVNPIVHVEQLRHQRRLIGRRRLGGINREIEDAQRTAIGTRQVGTVVGVRICVRIHVIAQRLHVPVVDPAIWRSRRVFRLKGQHLTRSLQRLQTRLIARPRRHRKRAVKWLLARRVRINSVGRITDVRSQTRAINQLAALSIHYNAEHLILSQTEGGDIPCEFHAVGTHWHPSQLSCRVTELGGCETLFAFTPFSCALCYNLTGRHFVIQ